MVHKIAEAAIKMKGLAISLDVSFSTHYILSMLGKKEPFRPLFENPRISEKYFDQVDSIQLAFNQAAIFDALEKTWTVYIPRSAEEGYHDERPLYLVDQLLKSRLMNRADWQQLSDKYQAQSQQNISLFRLNAFSAPEVQEEYARLLEELDIEDINTVKTEKIFENILTEESLIF